MTSILGVKDIFLLLLMIGFFSLLLTYHIGLNLPHTPEGHKEVKDVHSLNFLQNQINSEDDFNQQHRGGNNQQHLSEATQKLNLLDQIFKLEEQILSVSRLPALIRYKGGKDNSSKILEELLRHLDYNIVSQNGNELNTTEQLSLIWDLKGNNSTKTIVEDLKKTNRILQLQKIVLEPSYLCDVQKTQNAFSKVKVGDRTLCSVSPHLNKQTDLPFKRERDFVNLHKDGNITIQNQQIPQKDTDSISTLWAVSPGVLAVDGAPLSVRLSLLLTSLFPLRAYLHSSCQVFKVNETGQTLRQDLTSLWHVRQSIQQNFGETTMRGWWAQLRTGLMSALLTAEFDVWYSRAGNQCSCRRCFQSLDMDVVFTNEFQPIILKVKPSEPGKMTKEFLEDMVKLTSYKDPVYDDLMKTVGNIQLQKVHCKSRLPPCLTDSDLIYLLDTRREALAPVEFLQLYPSINEEYDPLMDHFLHKYFTGHDSPTDAITEKASCHLTPEAHLMVVEMERKHQQVIKGEQLSSRTIQHRPMFMSRKLDAEFSEDNLVNKEGSTLLSDKHQKNCSLVQHDLPLLSNISITPAYVQLTPAFEPTHTMYRAQVDYDTIVFSISATTSHCDATPRFHTLDGEQGLMNYTLGLGENQIRVHVVTTGASEPQIINTYIILIWRCEQGISSFRPSLRVCQLTQDCELPYSSSHSCGLHAVRQFRSWRTYQKHNSQLPICQQSDYQEASWFVPCEDCKNSNSCHWKTSIWQPKFCQTKHLDDYDIRACFKGRKVLFIGDSTNRGIMHYILEKINGSLSEWDKTHNLKLYKSINGNHTDLSFSYYPQFWLPTNHRPAFDKAIFQLIKWTRPLSDDNKTVLVVGGVHWLSGQHLDLIIKALNRENLTHIKLIAKGLGSGFHQHVSSVHYLPETEIQKLVQRERDLERHGTQLGFDFISTFNMTMARFKDFLQGKCACHFHKLSEVKNDRYDRTVYHVLGEINEIYSQMIINSICRN